MKKSMKSNAKTILTTVTASVLFSMAPLAMAGHANTVLSTTLSGAEEVGKGDSDGSGHGYVFGVDNDPKTLCYLIMVDGIQMVPVKEGMAAHIHEGAKGENGPPVVALAGPEDGNAADCLTEGEKGKFLTDEEGIVQRILENPSDFYINVHNPEFKGGAIRGQLMGPNHGHTM